MTEQQSPQSILSSAPKDKPIDQQRFRSVDEQMNQYLWSVEDFKKEVERDPRRAYQKYVERR